MTKVPTHDRTTLFIRCTSYVEPRRNPYVLDMPQQTQSHLQRQGDHGQPQKRHQRKLQQAHALEILRHFATEERVNGTPAQQIESTDNDCAEDTFADVRSDAENIGQIAVDLVDQAIVVPGLTGPEPLP